MALLFGSFLFADMPDDPQKHERDHTQKKLRGIRQNRNFRKQDHRAAKQEEKYPQLVDTPSLQYLLLDAQPVFSAHNRTLLLIFHIPKLEFVKLYEGIFRSNHIICNYGKHNCQSKPNEKEKPYKLFVLHVHFPFLSALLIQPKREKENSTKQNQRRPKQKRLQNRQVKNGDCFQNTVTTGNQYICDKKIS